MANVAELAADALAAGNGILRLAPTWVPRSFLQPGRRLKLHPADYYALGAHRGGIDERWFASTTPAANEGAPPDEGLSYCLHQDQRFTMQDAVAELGADMVGDAIWDEFGRWPVYSKFFDNMGPIPHHMHQNAEQAALARSLVQPIDIQLDHEDAIAEVGHERRKPSMHGFTLVNQQGRGAVRHWTALIS